MNLEKDLRYPAPPTDVAALLADRDFVGEVCAASGALSYDVDVVGDAGGAFTVTSTRTLPSDELPDTARRIIGDRVVLHQVDSWDAPAGDGSRRGTLSLDISGAPVTARATMTLTAVGTGSQQHLSGSVDARVPLIGGRIEKAAQPALLGALDQLEQLAAQRLHG